MPPGTPYDARTLDAALALVAQHDGNVSAAARAAGQNVTAFAHCVKRARAWKETQKAFDAPDLPDETADLGEILDRRRKEFKRVDAARTARKLVNIQIKVDGPFGIAHFGDPHVDDPGCDIEKLERHLAIVNKNEALFAGNVGDYTNNWVGRLAHLHSQQTTTAKEAWVLAEWLFNATRWLFCVGGNHDAWSGDRDPLQWIAKQHQHGVLYEPTGVRLNLVTPNGRAFRINARHDFRGHSMWNTAHGPSKAVQLGWRDHVASAGHKHTSGYQVLKDPSSGLITHVIRVAAYKTHDKYAIAEGFPDGNIFCCPVTIIDPRYADDDARCITTIFEPETASDFLKFLRKRKAA